MAQQQALQQNAQNQIALIDPASEAIQAIDKISREYGLITADGTNPFSAGLRLANGIAILRNAINDNIMGAVMSLQGSSIGFKTDKDRDGGYPMPVVRDAVIEALMRGLHLAGNEFNIISGKCYVTKEGFGTLLKGIPGLRYSLTPGIPRLVQGGAEATVKVEWKINDEEHCENLVFAIRVNSGMGADAINGKATRKARAWLYNRVTGYELADGDIENEEPLVSGAPSVAASRFTAKAKKAAPVKVEDAETTTVVAENASERTVTITAEPVEEAESPVQVNAEPTPEEQYPALAEALRQKNAAISVADMVEWHKAFKMALNEKAIVAQIDKCISDCTQWKQSAAQQK